MTPAPNRSALHPEFARRARAFLLAGTLLSAGSALAAESVRYVALVDGGKNAGHQVVTQGVDGVTRVDFIFKDNGRGPELKEEFALAPDGTFARYQVKGNSTFGAVVDESFSRSGNRVQWRSTSDQGGKDLQGGLGMYTPLSGSPEAFSVAIGALSRRADGKLPLIPSGTLTMRKVADARVGSGDRARDVQLLALTGVGFTPNFVWATTGESPRLFAFIAPGFVQLVEEGFEKDADALEARQKQAEGEALVDLQRRLAHPLTGTTSIRNVRVFDSEHATVGKPSDVLLRDGRIAAIAPAGTGAAADHVVDGDNRVLLPGLFDMHAHFSAWDGGLHMAAGITTIRDMGNDNATLQQLIADGNAGKLLSPHIVPAGFIEGESPMSARNGFVIKNLDEAKHAVDWYHAHGYPQIKIYNSFPKELVRDTAAYAHQNGMRVSGHVPAFMRAQDVVEQGYDEIQHINQLMLNFFVDDKTDTRTLQRFYLPAEKTADLDFDGRQVQDFIALLASHKTVIDPTLATFEFLHQRSGEMSPIVASVADHLPPDVQRGRRVAEMKIPDDATAARYTKSFDKMVEFVGRAYRAGVPVVAGTDELPGFTLQRELELYAKAGLTPSQVLQVATWNGAKYARVLDDRGSVAVGKRADLILVDGDPTADISDIRKVALVLKDGNAYYPSEIDTALGIAPFTAPLQVRTGGK
ncbi:MAG: amidohydrolase family protein [Luteimonas sp.]